MPARKLQKKFGTRKKPSSKKVTSSGRDLLGREKKRLQRIADLQAKYPNVSRDTIVDSMRYGKGKNPDQFQKSLIDSIKKEQTLKGIGKVAGTVGKGILTKGWFPLTIYDYLKGSPAGAESDVVPELTPAERKKQKEHIASQIHSSEYADAFPQRKSRGGKVKKKKKKTRSKPNKIMVGYKAGGKV